MRRRVLASNDDFPKIYPPENTIIYTTNDGNIINVHDYWEQPVQNYYDRKNNIGSMSFKHALTEIPGISGHPFFYSELNLLSLWLPITVKKLNWGCFFGCSNLYYVNVEDLNLDYLGYGCFELTNIQKLDFRNSTFTTLNKCCFIISTNRPVMDYILCPTTATESYLDIFTVGVSAPRCYVKTLMIPTINIYGFYYLEDTVLENLIINKFDGLADLHNFNTDCIIWVPDEWFDGYVDKYTNYTGNKFSAAQLQDIISRLRKYSDGVPTFPPPNPLLI